MSQVFDIETGPPLGFEPEPLVLPDEFDPSSVKLGRLVDKAKIEAKIEAAKKEHEDSIANYEEKNQEHIEKQYKDVCTNPTKGRVYAIGYYGGENFNIEHDKPEEVLLKSFWNQFEASYNNGRKLIGYFSSTFDVPFLRIRSYILGVRIPESVMDGTYRYYASTFLDLANVWEPTYGKLAPSLHNLCLLLGHSGKSEDEAGEKMDGGQFWKLYLGSPEERLKALEYLRNDLRMTWDVAHSLSIKF